MKLIFYKTTKKHNIILADVLLPGDKKINDTMVAPTTVRSKVLSAKYTRRTCTMLLIIDVYM